MKLDIIGSVARLKRVISRWIRQRRGKEHYNTKPTWSFLMDNIKWVFEFNCKKKKIMEQLSEQGYRFRVFKNQDEAMEFIEMTFKKA